MEGKLRLTEGADAEVPKYTISNTNHPQKQNRTNFTTYFTRESGQYLPKPAIHRNQKRG